MHGANYNHAFVDATCTMKKNYNYASIFRKIRGYNGKREAILISLHNICTFLYTLFSVIVKMAACYKE